jgi:PAS domain S-box-containing protein
MNFDTIITWSSDTNLKNLTPKGAVDHVTGYTIQEIKENSSLWLSMVHPDDKALFDSVAESLLRSENEELTLSYRIINKSGEIKNVTGSIKKKQNNGNIFFEGFIIDITKLGSRALSDNNTEQLHDLICSLTTTLQDDSNNQHRSTADALELISKTLNVKYSALFEFSRSENDEDYVCKRIVFNDNHEDKIEIQPLSDTLSLRSNFPTFYHKAIFERQPVYIPISEITSDGSPYPVSENCKGVILLPFWYNNQFYGFIELMDTRNTRYWNESTLKLLECIGVLVGCMLNNSRRNENNTSGNSVNLRAITHDLKNPLSTIELNISMIESSLLQKESFENSKDFEKINRIKRSLDKMKGIIEGL